MNTISPNGCNIAAGGGGSCSFTEEIREKISASKRGLKMPPHVREAISRAQLGRKQSPEAVERRISKLRGRKNGPISKETLKKVSGEGGPSAVLTWPQVVEIRRLSSLGSSQRSIAKLFGVSQMAICNIISNKTWKEELCPL